MSRPRNNPEDMRPAWMCRLSYERRYYWAKQKRALERVLLAGFPGGVCVITLQYAPGERAPTGTEHTKRVFDLLRRVKLRHGGSFRYVWTRGVLGVYPVCRIAVDPSAGVHGDLAALWKYGPATATHFQAAYMRDAVEFLCEYVDTDRAPTGKRRWTYSNGLGRKTTH